MIPSLDSPDGIPSLDSGAASEEDLEQLLKDLDDVDDADGPPVPVLVGGAGAVRLATPPRQPLAVLAAPRSAHGGGGDDVDQLLQDLDDELECDEL